MPSIEIIIADDEETIHDDIKRSLESARDIFFDFRIIKEFYGTYDLKIFLRSYKPSEDAETVLLLDNLFNSLPAGLQALPNIRRHCPNLPIIMLTTCEDADRAFTLARAQYNVEYIQKPVSGTQLRFRIESAIKAMHEADVNKKIEKLEKKIDNLANFIKNDMQNMIEKNKLPCRAEDDDADDALISQFISKLSSYINKNLDKSGNVLCEERDNLIKRFGPNWSRLLDTSRTSLVSAAVIWKRCEDIPDKNFDYSGVCISTTSALESELKKIFFDEFKSYIVNKYGMPSDASWKESFDVWPELLLDNTNKEQYEKAILDKANPHIKLSDYFTLGTLPYLFGQRSSNIAEDQSNKLFSLMNEYLSNIVKNIYKDNPISVFYSSAPTSFISECSKVRKKYRNKAAHRGMIEKSSAKDCFDKIAGEFGLLITLYNSIQ